MTNAADQQETLLSTAKNPKNNSSNTNTKNPRVSIRRIVRLFRPYRWSLLFVGFLVIFFFGIEFVFGLGRQRWRLAAAQIRLLTFERRRLRHRAVRNRQRAGGR